MGEGIITECESPPWPRWVLVALTLLGVFKGTPIQANRRCLLCRQKREGIECIFEGKNHRFMLWDAPALTVAKICRTQISRS